MTINKITLVVAIFFAIGQAYSQTDTFPTRGISISYTLNQERFQDTRMTFRERVEAGFITNISFFWSKKSSRHTIDLGFGKNIIDDDNTIAFFTNLRPQVSYTYQRKVNDFYIGGVLDIGSLLTFPVNSTWGGNNTISYTIWSSLGLAATYQKSLLIKNRPFGVSSSIQLPLVSYLIRPTYGLPYPSNYLEEGTFDFQRTGLTAALLTSGKIRSLDQFQRVNFRLGLSSFLTTKQHEIRLSYLFDYLNVSEVKSVRQIRNGVELAGAYKF